MSTPAGRCDRSAHAQDFQVMLALGHDALEGGIGNPCPRRDQARLHGDVRVRAARRRNHRLAPRSPVALAHHPGLGSASARRTRSRFPVTVRRHRYHGDKWPRVLPNRVSFHDVRSRRSARTCRRSDDLRPQSTATLLSVPRERNDRGFNPVIPKLVSPVQFANRLPIFDIANCAPPDRIRPARP
ncbi:hypothetical protein SAMN06295987_10655 [Novosphingobium mathurense]|uniref:Uncharacterized protein n=1 Tax=Novosphingobium mathurense TaxID=428990 RepID=A0A1U6IFE8_9SPHN|nr:hypothetical protein SAMN06295987_10655 [Novosphingobium mathurense]